MRDPPRERNPDLQWTVVSRKKPRPSSTHRALRTCFVNFLPITITSSEIAAIFKTHGSIDSIYIPISQNTKAYKCAFVRFLFPQSLPTALRDVHGRRLGKHRITVHQAKQDKPLPKQDTDNAKPFHIPPKTQNNPHQNHYPSRHHAYRDSRTYKEASLPTHPIPVKSNKQNYPHFQSEINPSELTFASAKPSPQRIMSSRSLGEDTEKVRGSLGQLDLEEDYAAALNGEVCEDNREMLERSAIAVAASSQSSDDILSHILAEGVTCLNISPMGGMLHLVTFETFADKKEMMESKWLEKWFLVLRNVNDESSMMWRETWLKVSGVPLIAWGHENFYKIGCVYGRVLSVNQKNYECAYILVFTDVLFQINNKLSLDVQGKKYPIFVSVTKYPQPIHQATFPNEKHAVNVNGGSPRDVDPLTQQENIPRTSTTRTDNSTPTISKEPNQNQNDTCPNKPPENLGITNHPYISQNNPTQSYSDYHHERNADKSLLNDLPDPALFSMKKIPLTSPIREPIDFSSPSKLIEIPPQKSPQNQNDVAQPNLNHSKINSPIQLHNKYGPLLKRPSHNPSSSRSMGSSSSSGPLFPPGFEDRVPAHVKIAQAEKREKKLEKKKKLKLHSKNKKAQDPFPNQNFGSITVDDIIDLSGMIGLSFDGHTSELRRRIQAILQGQVQVWDNHHQ